MNEDQQQKDAQSPHPVKPRKTVGTCEYYIIAILSLFPPFGIALLLIATADAIIRRRTGAGRLILVSFVCLGLGLILAMILPGPIGAYRVAKDSQTKSNVHTIQIHLEQWASDHGGLYPSSIRALIQDGYLTEPLVNPFTQAPMKEIAFGSSPFEGEFTYVPVFDDGHVRSFYLLGYGDRDKWGYDVDGDAVDDHVLIIVTSGVQVPGIHPVSAASAEVPIESGEEWPSLKDLLRAQRENPQVPTNDGHISAGGE